MAKRTTAPAERPRGEREDEGSTTATDFVRQLVRFFTVDLWRSDLWRADGTSIPRLRAAALRSLRVMSLAVQRFFAQRTLFHASSLTYITILSLVPVLAVGFSMAKGMGAYERLRERVIEPFLDRYIGPAAAPVPPAAAAEEAPPAEGPAALRAGIDKLLEFVDRTDFSVLGFFASAAMLLTVIKLLGAVERSLNEIWGIHRARSLARKFSDYLSLVIVTPVVLLTATGITASTQIQSIVDRVRTVWDFGPLLTVLAPAFTLVVIWIGFTFVYLVMPNTRVKFASALVGGIVGGTLWQMVQVLHVKSQVGMAQYEVLYAGFAAFPILLFWIYLSWVVMLLGVHVAFAHQNERTFRGFAFFRAPNQAVRDHVALRAAIRIGQAFESGERPPRLDSLAVRIGAPERLLSEVLDRLARSGILVPVGRTAIGRYVPARDPAKITVAEMLEATRHAGKRQPAPAREPLDGFVNDLLDRMEADVAASSANRTLLELVEDANRLERRRGAGRGEGT